MQEDNIKQSIVIFACVLNACSGIGALHEGMQMHRLVIQAGFESDIIIANSLIDMYAINDQNEGPFHIFQISGLPLRGSLYE